MTGALSLVNLVLTLLNSIVQWGARTKVFKEDEALIASQILVKVTKEIKDAHLIRESVNAGFDSDPSSILQPDEFTRPAKDKRSDTERTGS
jgi:hypothetical protein